MKKQLPRELIYYSKDKSKQEIFEERCKFYAYEVTNSGQQRSFITSCRYYLVGHGKKRAWTPEEREWHLEILEKYFPEEMDRILEYEREEKRIMAKKELFKKQLEESNSL